MVRLCGVIVSLAALGISPRGMGERRGIPLTNRSAACIQMRTMARLADVAAPEIHTTSPSARTGVSRSEEMLERPLRPVPQGRKPEKATAETDVRR